MAKKTTSFFEEIRLLHGPGCPVCVTPVSLIDQALELAGQSDIILASFGDMMRVPGTKEDLLQAKAHGADVRMLYSPLDAIELAETNPKKEVVFFAIGFGEVAGFPVAASLPGGNGQWHGFARRISP